MAVTIQSVTPAAYDPTLDFKSDSELLRLALDGNVGAANRVTRDGADFIVQARSTASEGPTLVLELMTARLVPFPTGFMRVLTVEAWITGNGATEQAWGRLEVLIQGGTTPVAVNGVLNASTPVQVPVGNSVAAVGAGIEIGRAHV